MQIVPIAEPVRVLALGVPGELRPLRFQWQERTYRVAAINGHWRERQGEVCDLHYSVQVGDETYFLRFASRDCQWWLEQMVVPG